MKVKVYVLFVSMSVIVQSKTVRSTVRRSTMQNIQHSLSALCPIKSLRRKDLHGVVQVRAIDFANSCVYVLD